MQKIGTNMIIRRWYRVPRYTTIAIDTITESRPQINNIIPISVVHTVSLSLRMSWFNCPGKVKMFRRYKTRVNLLAVPGRRRWAGKQALNASIITVPLRFASLNDHFSVTKWSIKLSSTIRFVGLCNLRGFSHPTNVFTCRRTTNVDFSFSLC